MGTWATSDAYAEGAVPDFGKEFLLWKHQFGFPFEFPKKYGCCWEHFCLLWFSG